jgi:long-chain acyl-CoA synthetase
VVEWVLADMGVLCAGGVSNGIYPTDSPEPGAVPVRPTRAPCVIFVEDEEQLDKVLEVREQLPRLQQDRGLRHERPARIQGRPGDRRWTRCAKAGRAWLHQATPASSRNASAASRTPDDLAILVYTSGTTGRNPRARCTCHGALTCTACARPTSRCPSWLVTTACASCRCATSPSAWWVSTRRSIPARVLNFVENPDTMPENVREISPTFLFAVPPCGRSSTSAVIIGDQGGVALQQAAYAWAIGDRRQVAGLVLAGQPVPDGG